MGAFLEKPNTEKENEHGSGNGLRYGLSSMQGWRVEMEDAHSAVIGLPLELDDWSFFAVYDGHAGSKVAKHCSQHILNEISSYLASSKVDGKVNPSKAAVHDAITTGFLSIDSKMRAEFARTDSSDKSGSTAVGVIISPTHFFFANCGDSRAVLSRKGQNQPAFFTDDHKPGKPSEMKRIEDAGGSVMIERVNGSLAVSRALGDYDYKNNPDMAPTEQLVSPEPEVTIIERKKDEDEFIILACDGIWDVMANDELCHFIRSRLAITDKLEDICNQVVETCLQKGSRDNMSIEIVTFQNAPAVSEAALTKERELDKLLEEKVKEVVESFGDQTQLDLVMHVLRMADIPGLPPGGGIQAKKGTVEEILGRLNPNMKQEEESSNETSW